LLGLIAFILLLPSISKAERLPIKTYTVADGLAHNSVHPMFQDAKGFLWLATAEGLSRFDGYSFTNYGIEDGLGHIFVNHIAVDRSGRLWVATNGGGVARLMDEPPKNENPSARKKFVSFSIEEGGEKNQVNSVNQILFDAENRMWCLTDNGLFRARRIEVAERDFELVVARNRDFPYAAHAALADSRGRLWFGSDNQAIQIADGKTIVYEPVREANQPAAKSPAWNAIEAFAEDESGRIFAADTHGIYEFVEPQNEAARGAWRKLPIDFAAAQVGTIAAGAAVCGSARISIWCVTAMGNRRFTRPPTA
jgi:ligand-binding sensor domain-containing protein